MPVAFFDNVIKPAVCAQAAVVYGLTETRAVRAMFGRIDLGSAKR